MLEAEKIRVVSRTEELKAMVTGFQETQAQIDAMGGEKKVK